MVDGGVDGMVDGMIDGPASHRDPRCDRSACIVFPRHHLRHLCVRAHAFVRPCVRSVRALRNVRGMHAWKCMTPHNAVVPDDHEPLHTYRHACRRMDAYEACPAHATGASHYVPRDSYRDLEAHRSSSQAGSCVGSWPRLASQPVVGAEFVVGRIKIWEPPVQNQHFTSSAEDCLALQSSPQAQLAPCMNE